MMTAWEKLGAGDAAAGERNGETKEEIGTFRWGEGGYACCRSEEMEQF